MSREDERIVSYSKNRNKEKVPFVIYADLESILDHIDDSKSTGSIRKYQKQVPCNVVYYLCCSCDISLNKFDLYMCKGAGLSKNYKLFLAHLLNPWFINPFSMIPFNNQLLVEHSYIIFEISRFLLILNCVTIVRGKYRGPKLYSCNLNYVDDLMMPVEFHNSAYFIFMDN